MSSRTAGLLQSLGQRDRRPRGGHSLTHTRTRAAFVSVVVMGEKVPQAHWVSPQKGVAALHCQNADLLCPTLSPPEQSPSVHVTSHQLAQWPSRRQHSIHAKGVTGGGRGAEPPGLWNYIIK